MCSDLVIDIYLFVLFSILRRPPISTRTDTLFPYTTLFRSNMMVDLLVLLQGDPGDLLARTASTARVQHIVQLSLAPAFLLRSEEHTSELQSLMRSSYAVFCLKKKTYKKHILRQHPSTTKQSQPAKRRAKNS